jgi:hypothetical protein
VILSSPKKLNSKSQIIILPHPHAIFSYICIPVWNFKRFNLPNRLLLFQICLGQSDISVISVYVFNSPLDNCAPTPPTLKVFMYAICIEYVYPKGKRVRNWSLDQGDQMSFWINRPKCSPANFLSK